MGSVASEQHAAAAVVAAAADADAAFELELACKSGWQSAGCLQQQMKQCCTAQTCQPCWQSHLHETQCSWQCFVGGTAQLEHAAAAAEIETDAFAFASASAAAVAVAAGQPAAAVDAAAVAAAAEASVAAAAVGTCCLVADTAAEQLK